MLYSYDHLQGLSMADIEIPLKRYLYKFQNQRKEIKKLKAHEKDFLFKNMYILRNEKDERCFDLTTIDEASEYYFNKLILIYYDNLNFIRPTLNPFRQIIDNQTMNKDKVDFEKYFEKWKIALNNKKGRYVNIISIEFFRKIEELRLIFEEGRVTEADHNYHIKYLWALLIITTLTIK